MSAILCGKRRSLFEDLSCTTTPVSKKLRCSSTSPVRFPLPKSSIVEKLKEFFPLMDNQLLEQALEECGNDIDAAIKRLHELCLGSSEENGAPANNGEANVDQGVGGVAANEPQQPGPLEEPSVVLPADGTQWVELFVREMMSATSVDDARARASRVLEVLEKSIAARASAEASDDHQKENLMLKEQIQVLMGENTILKRLVQKQHERQKEYEDQVQEAQHLKQLIPQYQEQIRNLEVRNYALSMHLKQAEQSNSIPGRFHPDVF